MYGVLLNVLNHRRRRTWLLWKKSKCENVAKVLCEVVYRLMVYPSASQFSVFLSEELICISEYVKLYNVMYLQKNSRGRHLTLQTEQKTTALDKRFEKLKGVVCDFSAFAWHLRDNAKPSSLSPLVVREFNSPDGRRFREDRYITLLLWHRTSLLISSLVRFIKCSQ